MADVRISDGPGPWAVIPSKLAEANIYGLAFEAKTNTYSIMRIMEYEPEKFAREPNQPGGHEYSISLIDCPGGALVIKFSLDRQRMEVRILEVIHPALVTPRPIN
jgi:hypothetical protein